MQRIGIFGGTFDPFHIGHLTIAEEAFNSLKLDKMLIMPTGNPGYKGRDDINDKEVRAKMVINAIKDNPHFEFCDIELNREGIIYTADTLKILAANNEDVEYFFVIGGDSLSKLEYWYHPEEIFKYATIVATTRNDVKGEVYDALIERLNAKYNTEIIKLNVNAIDISSSLIREKIKNNEDYRNLVDENTYKFIEENGLYRC